MCDLRNIKQQNIRFVRLTVTFATIMQLDPWLNEEVWKINYGSTSIQKDPICFYFGMTHTIRVVGEFDI